MQVGASRGFLGERRGRRRTGRTMVRLQTRCGSRRPAPVFLTGRERFPTTGQQLLHLRILHCGQSLEHVGQIFLRIDPAPPATLNDGVDHRAAPTRLGMPNKQPAAATHGGGPDIIFHQIVVDRRSWFLEEERQMEEGSGVEPHARRHPWVSNPVASRLAVPS